MAKSEKHKGELDYSTVVTINAKRYRELVAKVESLANTENGFDGDVFYVLANYAEGSLLDEELALMKADVATRQEHHLHHQKFLARLDQIRKGLEQGNPQINKEIVAFLDGWYNEHFVGFHGLSM
ncbi:hemerythrin domain-containing protein [Williamwhitmania taraxaci]|uniref:Hemerythrin n=1 Tax=Williamwhitmania taraxaci TaxID=1640674 RepID=A0A1G6PEN5_9BACT|nr:hypothetical protein [Williamwhitmania taraxaci]SDC78529.1 hypothetical protein SAMN05216323_105114 [Williamwhitmania taraxaci]